MHRISSDADYLRDGTIRIDADGVSVDIGSRQRAPVTVTQLKDKLIEGFTATSITLLANDKVATLAIRDLKGPATGLMILPVGSIPSQASSSETIFPVLNSAADNDVALGYLYASGSLSLYNSTAGSSYSGSISWPI